MPVGMIKWYNHNRGWGRIRVYGGSKRNCLHFHCTEISDSAKAALIERGRVTFEIVEGVRGPKAIKIQAAV